MLKCTWKRITAALLVCSSIFVLAACGENDDPNTEGDTAKDEVVIAMPQASEPEAGFDPCYGWGAGEHVHEPLIQSTLLASDVNLEIITDLALDYQISEDGLVWTVEIRDDAVFTDGEPVKASDVAFTYETVKENTSVNDLTMLERCEVVDDTTVEFHLSNPQSTFAYTMTVVGILPEHAYGPDYGQNPIGSGRYVMAQWDKGQQVILLANENYYGEAPKISKVTVLFMDEAAAFAAAKSGQVDVAYTAASYSDQNIDGMSLEAYASVDNRGISMPVVKAGGKTEEGYDLGNDVTADIAIRKALAYGLDRLGLADAVLNGYGTPAYSVCDGMPWYNSDAEVDFDLDKALDILEDSGWYLSDDGIRVKEGLRAEFTLLYPSSDSLRQAAAMEISNQAKELGIDITVEGVSWDDADARVPSTPMLYGWGANNPMEFYNLYYSGVHSNIPSYSNPVVDGYMDQALAAVDMEQSYEYWKLAQWDGESGITPEGDVPWIWLLNIEHLYFVKNDLNVADQKIHPHGHGWSIANNVDAWYWE